jgi:hypothetical protein
VAQQFGRRKREIDIARGGQAPQAPAALPPLQALDRDFGQDTVTVCYDSFFNFNRNSSAMCTIGVWIIYFARCLLPSLSLSLSPAPCSVAVYVGLSNRPQVCRHPTKYRPESSAKSTTITYLKSATISFRFCSLCLVLLNFLCSSLFIDISARSSFFFANSTIFTSMLSSIWYFLMMTSFFCPIR